MLVYYESFDVDFIRVVEFLEKMLSSWRRFAPVICCSSKLVGMRFAAKCAAERRLVSIRCLAEESVI